MDVLQPDFKKRGGLVDVVTQNAKTLEVLMVASTDKAGYLETLETGFAVYFSKSRNRRWKKGEESGDTLLVKEVRIDCDSDALVYLVEPQGRGACHTGARSCFFRTVADVALMEAPEAHYDGPQLMSVDVHANLSGMPGYQA